MELRPNILPPFKYSYKLQVQMDSQLLIPNVLLTINDKFDLIKFHLKTLFHEVPLV